MHCKRKKETVKPVAKIRGEETTKIRAARKEDGKIKPSKITKFIITQS